MSGTMSGLHSPEANGARPVTVEPDGTTASCPTYGEHCLIDHSQFPDGSRHLSQRERLEPCAHCNKPRSYHANLRGECRDIYHTCRAYHTDSEARRAWRLMRGTVIPSGSRSTTPSPCGSAASKPQSSISSHPTSEADRDVLRLAPSSALSASLTPHDPKTCSACLYTNLGVMCAASIEAAFSGQNGTLRETPETYQRRRDARGY